jgi:hypothetical protein
MDILAPRKKVLVTPPVEKDPFPGRMLLNEPGRQVSDVGADTEVGRFSRVDADPHEDASSIAER